jgi:hypothetical protein
MAELQRVHCRFCGQTFLTSGTESQRCDACGKSGGLVSPDVIAAEQRRQEEEQRARRESQRTGGLSTRQYIASFFTLILFLGVWYQLTSPAQPGSYTWWYETGLVAVGALGSLATWLWPKKGRSSSVSAPPAESSPPQQSRISEGGAGRGASE